MNLEDLLRHVIPSDLGSAAASAAGDSQGHGVEHLVGASASGIHRGGRRRLPDGGGERPPALGEVTLEDFLSRAGAAADGGGGGRGGDWLQRNHHQQGITGIYVTSPLAAAAAAATAPARKRAPAPAPEKTVERRQKRMIKNRESAARSRARRQAYTNELENKVSRLEEENERLRKEQQQLEPVVHCVPQQEQKHQLRRTSSAPF